MFLLDSSAAVTTIYDPLHPAYLDEYSVREEMTRVFDLCHGCRRCSTFCSSFTTLFQMLEEVTEHSAGQMTPSQQDQVVSECYQCKRCVIECPYTPELHEWALDFPRLMMRAQSMRRACRYVPRIDRVATRVLAGTQRLGMLAARKVSVRGALWRKISASPPRSRWRRVAARSLGVSADRMLPVLGKKKFSTWFASRPLADSPMPVPGPGSNRRVTVFPTCFVESRAPGIGQSLVQVLERSGVSCARSALGCCGAPWLHAGDLEKFSKMAGSIVSSMHSELDDGSPILVAQPSCRYVMTQEYPRHLPGTRAGELAQLLIDPAEYLMGLHARGDLDLGSAEPSSRSVTFIEPFFQRGLLRDRDSTAAARRLLELAGFNVTLLEYGDGVDVIWPLRAVNQASANSLRAELVERIQRAGNDLVIGELQMTNLEVSHRIGRPVLHLYEVVGGGAGTRRRPALGDHSC